MSAVLKMARAFTGTGPAARVAKFKAALTASDARLERLNAELEAAGVAFHESADPTTLRELETALAGEQSVRKAIVSGLAAATEAERVEREAEAARLLAAKHERLRAEATRFGETITEKLIELGKLFGSHEAIVEALPSNERFHFWIPDYAAAATKELIKDVDGTSHFAYAASTRQFEIQLTVPLTKVD